MAAVDAPRRGRGGFTLLELLVSIAILSFLAGSVMLGIRLASGSIERGESAARDAARLRAVVGIVERSVRSLDPLPIPVGDNTTAYFSGEEKKIRFLTDAAPEADRGGGLRLISFFELPGPRGGGLAMGSASPFRPEKAEGWEGTESPRLLLPGAVDLSFAYSGGPTKEGAWEWFPTWDLKERGRLPAAVRVEFAEPAEGGPRKTAFVVPVPVGGRPGG